MALFQIGIVLIASTGLWWIGKSQLAASFAVGAGLMLANLLALAWTSWRMFTKKPVALTVGVIVIKYALLLGSVFYFARSSWFDSIGAGLGIGSFVLAILGSAVVSKSEEEEV